MNRRMHGFIASLLHQMFIFFQIIMHLIFIRTLLETFKFTIFLMSEKSSYHDYVVGNNIHQSTSGVASPELTAEVGH
jgi:hypothetical protein